MTTQASAANLDLLSESDWQARRSAHERRVDQWIHPHLQRQSRQEKHPVYDFLFSYYSFRPAQLRRWHPGCGVILQGVTAGEFLGTKEYQASADGVVSSLRNVPERRKTVLWIRQLLTATQNRPPMFGCHGLHEWAMVYRADHMRHPYLALRLPAAEVNAVVDRHVLRCTHYDAFRFFQPGARPLNRFDLRRETIVDVEQPGCLHANMDLYKWCYKLSPFLPGELTADAFALAREIREVDMRASPYDLSAFGFAPIPIETPEGKCEYEKAQRLFASQAVELRAAILGWCERILAE